MRFILSALILTLALPSTPRADTIDPKGLWSTHNGGNGPAPSAPKPKPKLKR